MACRCMLIVVCRWMDWREGSERAQRAPLTLPLAARAKQHASVFWRGHISPRLRYARGSHSPVKQMCGQGQTSTTSPSPQLYSPMGAVSALHLDWVYLRVHVAGRRRFSQRLGDQGVQSQQPERWPVRYPTSAAQLFAVGPVRLRHVGVEEGECSGICPGTGLESMQWPFLHSRA